MAVQHSFFFFPAAHHVSVLIRNVLTHCLSRMHARTPPNPTSSFLGFYLSQHICLSLVPLDLFHPSTPHPTHTPLLSAPFSAPFPPPGGLAVRSPLLSAWLSELSAEHTEKWAPNIRSVRGWGSVLDTRCGSVGEGGGVWGREVEGGVDTE